MQQDWKFEKKHALLLGLLFVGLAAIAFAMFYDDIREAYKRSQGPPRIGAEYGLAINMEQNVPMIDVLGVKTGEKSVHVALVDLKPDVRWSKDEQLAMDRAVLLAMEFASKRELGLILQMWNLRRAMNIQGQPVDIYEGSVKMICNAKLLMQINYADAVREDIFINCLILAETPYPQNSEYIMWPGR